MSASRVFALLVAGVLVILVATTLISGDALLLIPALVLLAIVGGYAVFQTVLRQRLDHAYDGRPEAAMSDGDDPVPSAHLVPDDGSPLGATSEVHDEISPHDLPKGHPSRNAVVKAAGGEDGTARSSDVEAVIAEEAEAQRSRTGRDAG